MSKCDIKESNKAWNDGVDAFYKAYVLSKGKRPTEALKYAINEVKMKNPDFDFESKSFTDPIIASLKEKGKLSKSYSFGEANTKEDSYKKKIDKMSEKLNGLNESQKKDFAKKSFEKLSKDGKLTDENVKKFYAESLGMKSVDEKLNKIIDRLHIDMKAVDNVDAEIKQVYKDIQVSKDSNEGKLTKESNKEFKTKIAELSNKRDEALKNYIKSSTDFAEQLQSDGHWSYTFTDMIRMNLMNPLSLIKNATGMASDAVFRNMSYALASPISQYILKPITKINSNPIGARTRGSLASKALKKGKTSFTSGQAEFGEKLPQVNHLDALRAFKKASESMGMEKLKNYTAAVLKISPDLVGRSLSSTDAVEYNRIYSAELSRIAESKGLKGAEKDLFMLSPDEKSIDIASQAADKVTFKTKLPTILGIDMESFSKFNPNDFEKKLIKDGYSPIASKTMAGASYLARTITFPFIKTPANLVIRSTGILLPELTLARAISKSKKETDPIEKQRILLEGSTNALIGFHIRLVALKLIGLGAISAGFEDDDEKTRDVVEQKSGGPNRFNYNSFLRGMSFMDMTEKKGDRYVDINSTGLLGLVLGSHAHAYNQYSKEDIAKQTQYTKDWTNAFTIPADAFTSQFSASLDYTFFSGFNQLERMIKNKSGNERPKYLANQLASVFGGIIPGTIQKISTQVSPNVKKTYDNDESLAKNIQNIFGYRFFFQDSKMKNKYFSLASENGAVKKKDYMLFDDMFGRVLQAEFGVFKSREAKVDGPIPRLYDAIKELGAKERDDLLPSAVSDKLSIHTRSKGKGKTVKVELTPEQHEYLQGQASNYRMMLVTPYIMSPEFKKDNFETKKKTMSKIYEQGLNMAKDNFKEVYSESYKEARKKSNKKSPE